ncbi:MAG TPA: PRC-barrel domain-containing protein [Pseudolabrys sp.]|nr:PRC-barrel domain-containing protein [Pseudolabrys sp.]
MRAKCFALVFIWAAISSIAGLQILRADDVVPMQLKPPVATVDGTPARGILGRTVQDADSKEMGRIIDVVVDPAGRVRAAIIDFGGFLGVGSRKIAVDWSALHFGGGVKREGDIRLALTQDQLKAAPEYKEGNPVVIIGSTGAFEPLSFPSAATPEK